MINPIYLVLCNSGDKVAMWIADELNHLNLNVEVLNIRDLLTAKRWVINQNNGRSTWEIHLLDGRIYTSTSVMGGINRLVHLPLHLFEDVDNTDRDYALQEWQAVITAFLGSIGGLLFNKPNPTRLHASYICTDIEWYMFAFQSGLPMNKKIWDLVRNGSLDIAFLSLQTFFIINREVIPSTLQNNLKQKCILLSQVLGYSLLEVWFGTYNNEVVFLGGTPIANLEVGGKESITVVANYLRGESSK